MRQYNASSKANTHTGRRISKSERPNKKLSYCQHPARGLDRDDDTRKNAVKMDSCALKKKARVNSRASLSIDGDSTQQQVVEDMAEPLPASRLLELPTEIRQQILFSTLDDEDLLHAPAARLEATAQHFARVCSTCRRDISRVLRAWCKKGDELLQRQNLQRGAFDSYIKDFMTPIKISAQALSKRKRSRMSTRREIRRAEGDAKVADYKLDPKSDTFRAEERVRGREGKRRAEENSDEPSKTEKQITDQWRLRRTANRADMLKAAKKMREAYR